MCNNVWALAGLFGVSMGMNGSQPQCMALVEGEDTVYVCDSEDLVCVGRG